MPSLRNIALTAPYFHNGSVERLEDAVAVMARVQLGLRIAKAGEQAPRTYRTREGRLQAIEAKRQSISRDELGELVAFLHTLSDERLRNSAARPSRP